MVLNVIVFVVTFDLQMGSNQYLHTSTNTRGHSEKKKTSQFLLAEIVTYMTRIWCQIKIIDSLKKKKD